MRHILGSLAGTQRLVREVWHSWRIPIQPEESRSPLATARAVRLGSGTVFLETEQQEAGGPTYINLHENEQTSVDAARAVMSESAAGRMVRLRAQGRRHVVFWEGARPFAFDPNRIFTNRGIEQTLRRYSSLTESASETLRRLRASVLEMLQTSPNQPVIALHNNAGIDYSASEYQHGRRLAADASAIAIGSLYPPEDFFVVTEPSWFERLAATGFNVVLQSPNARDDGSLSIWFQRNGRSYINVEARHGRLQAQQLMLRAVAAELVSCPSNSSAEPSSLSKD
jgi:hypothetical protein